MLTDAQLATLKADIQTNQAVNAAAGNHAAIVAYYNAAGTGFVWRPHLTVEELNTAINWSDFAALLVAKQNTYLAMITAGSVDASSASIRAGFSTVFGAASTSLANLTTLAQKTPSRLEQLFAAGNVTTVFGYSCTINDVLNALALP